MNKKKGFVFFIGLNIVFILWGESQDRKRAMKKEPLVYYSAHKGVDSFWVNQLGRALFYDPVLSTDSTISCASCHNSYTAFAHVDHALSHGIKNRIGRRNAPALMNLRYYPVLMWDGAIVSLEMQALAPLHDTAEMSESFQHVLEKLNRQKRYREWNQKAWGYDSVNSSSFLKSVASFVASLQSFQSKYDSVQRGEQVFTKQEQSGYRLFKTYCAICHTEPLFTNLQFRKNGLFPDSILNDTGRERITHQASDRYLFRVPTLRNIEFSYPYMHDGRFLKLSAVLDHYMHIGKNNSQVSPELKAGVRLTANEKTDLIAFLLCLSDRAFIFNTQFTYPFHLLNQ